MNDENTNWGQSVAGVVMKDNKVLLARHTYGNGMLIIPGGYVNVILCLPQNMFQGKRYRIMTRIVKWCG